MSENKPNYTPMMQQYLKIKEDYADAIVFFRLGDFYEMFFDDALIASKVLEIALTSRDAGHKVPMCGVPHHAAKVYIQKLVEKGFKVAIAEQITEPGKGLVEREVTQLITPGMIIDEGMIDAKNYNFIGSIDLKEHGYMLSYADLSTGETFIMTHLSYSDLIDEVLSLNLKEIVVSHIADVRLIDFIKGQGVLVSNHTFDYREHRLTKQLSTKDEKYVACLLIDYLESTQKQDLRHFMHFSVLNKKSFMKIDYKVDRHLEITQSLYNQPQNTLLYYLDQTKTAMGSRRLKHYLSHPLIDATLLEERYDYIDAFRTHENAASISDILSYIYDINRIVGRISLNHVNAKDLYWLGQTLNKIPELKALIRKEDSPMMMNLYEKLDPHTVLKDLLNAAIVDNPPLTIKEGGMIKSGFNETLDALLDISTHGAQWLSSYEQKQREMTGIKNLKVGYNRVFGYFIEISKGNLGIVNDSFGYERKQTLANSERFITPELKEKEDDLLHAKEKAVQLEYEIFVKLREEAFKYAYSLQTLASLIADIDAYLSLAQVSIENRYVRPKLKKDRFVEVVNGRHPVVEKHVEFVANSVSMKASEIFLITGPNMSGKSTYMRMFALIIYMAQIGSFVPADFAALPIYDAIYTRIGSSDDLAGGKSTFMVEMIESNVALTQATKQSIILFDEIGRGTATYDGMALAQGMIEYVHDYIGAQMLFSTHYHELTQLDKTLDNVTNLHVSAKEEKNSMVFLHQIKSGPSDKSYGIQVAALAKLPEPLIKRSKQILSKLERKVQKEALDLFTLSEPEDNVKTVIDHKLDELVLDLESVNLDHLTPLDALVRLKYYQEILKKNK